MNGRTAKQLRRSKPVKAAGGWNNVEYDIKPREVQHFDANGQLVAMSRTNVATLKPGCGRKAYKTMKNIYKEVKANGVIPTGL